MDGWSGRPGEIRQEVFGTEQLDGLSGTGCSRSIPAIPVNVGVKVLLGSGSACGHLAWHGPVRLYGRVRYPIWAGFGVGGWVGRGLWLATAWCEMESFGQRPALEFYKYEPPVASGGFKPARSGRNDVA